MLQLDHVIIAVRDLESAAERLRADYGLVALPGGVHPGGTKNRVIPLAPPQYLELLAVHDERKLATRTFGRRMLRGLEVGDQLFWWAVRTDDIDAAAARTGRKPEGGTITTADGTTAPGWRIVDPPDADAAWLPFFIQYNIDRAQEMERRRARYSEAASPAQPGGFAWIEVAGDESVLRDWLHEDLPVRVVDGLPGLRAVGIESPRGEIVIR